MAKQEAIGLEPSIDIEALRAKLDDPAPLVIEATPEQLEQLDQARAEKATASDRVGDLAALAVDQCATRAADSWRAAGDHIVAVADCIKAQFYATADKVEAEGRVHMKTVAGFAALAECGNTTALDQLERITSFNQAPGGE